MKTLSLLIMTAVLGISTNAFAGGGGGGGVLQMASFSSNELYVFGLESDSQSQLVAVAVWDNGKWTVSKEVIEHSEVQGRPELNGAIRQSEVTRNWAPVSQTQSIQQ